MLILGLAFTYIAAPLALFLTLARVLRNENLSPWLLLVVAFGAAPALISRILIWLLHVVPGNAPAVYVATIVLVFVGLAAFGARALPKLRQMADETGHWLRGNVRTVAGAFILGATLPAVLLNPSVAAWISSLYARAISSYNLGASGWAGTMPPFATAALLATVIVALARPLEYRQTSGAPQDRKAPAGSGIVEACLGALLVALLGMAFLLLFGRPLYENDATQYFKVATLMYEARSVAFYPLVPAAPDGTFASSAHPLGHYGSLIWSFMFAGTPAPGVAKVGIVAGALATLSGLWLLLHRYGAAAMLAAMVILISTPGYFIQFVSGGIDTNRLMLLFLAAMALGHSAREGSWLGFLVASVVAGLALQSHSQSGILVPFAILGAALAFRAPWKKKIALVVSGGLIAFAVGGEQYVLNLIRFGSPFNNEHTIWKDVPSLDYRGWRLGRAPRTDLWGRLSAGPFIGFTWWWIFGLSWWLALLGGVLGWRTIQRDRPLAVLAFLTATTLAFLFVFYGFTGDGELLVMNYRYPMSVQPVLAALAGLLVGGILTYRGLLRPLGLFTGVVVLALGGWIILAREVVPELPRLRLGALDRSRFAELDAMPAHATAGYLGELEALRELRAKTSKDAFFLTFFQNNFSYYSERRFIRDVDPRMIPFYRATTKELAIEELQRLGINHVYIPSWSWPTIDRSHINGIVNDPALAELLVSQFGYRVYRLNFQPKAQ